jgi:hypothetical protein
LPHEIDGSDQAGVIRDNQASPQLPDTDANGAHPQQTFLCPTCRTRIPVPPGGASTFHTNPYIRDDELQRAREETQGLTHACATFDLFCVDCDSDLRELQAGQPPPPQVADAAGRRHARQGTAGGGTRSGCARRGKVWNETLRSAPRTASTWRRSARWWKR